MGVRRNRPSLETDADSEGEGEGAAACDPSWDANGECTRT